MLYLAAYVSEAYNINEQKQICMPFVISELDLIYFIDLAMMLVSHSHEHQDNLSWARLSVSYSPPDLHW